MTYCPFCDSTRLVHCFGSCASLLDGFPVSDGHTLVVPFRHTPTFFTMTDEERADAFNLIERRAKTLLSDDETIEGFNIGINCGEVAGQTVMHAHIHLIPRRQGDTPEPRGGVRGVIPGRMAF